MNTDCSEAIFKDVCKMNVRLFTYDILLKKLADAKKSLYICKSICIPVNCIIALRSCNLSFRGINMDQVENSLTNFK